MCWVLIWCRHNSIRIVTKLRAGVRGFTVGFPAGAKGFFGGSEASSHSLGPSQPSTSFPRKQNGNGVNLTTHLRLVYSLTMSGGVPSLLHMPSWRAQWQLYFYVYF
jgi:hypothetical protein